jgi:hypothetical protein
MVRRTDAVSAPLTFHIASMEKGKLRLKGVRKKAVWLVSAGFQQSGWS